MNDSESVDDTCDHCQGEATLFCNQCKSSYCSTCSSVRHRAEKRKEHFVVRISQLYMNTRVLSVDPPKKTIHNEGKLLKQALSCKSGRSTCHNHQTCTNFLIEHQDAQLMGLLMKFFKKNAFKDWQLCAIKATLGGKNALIVQPTGSGKSLCFQFPCTITAKMTIVLLPTVSLIMDQIKALEKTGLRVTYLGMMQNDRTVMGKSTTIERQLEILQEYQSSWR